MSYVALVPVTSKDEVTTPRADRNREPTKYNYGKITLFIVFSAAGLSSLAVFKVITLWLAATIMSAVLILTAIIINESVRYGRIMANTVVDVDVYMAAEPSLKDRIYVTATHRLTVGSLKKSKPLELSASPSPYVSNLMLTSRFYGNDNEKLCVDPNSKNVIIGSIRMGFGHHRIGRAASTWGVGIGLNTYFHDLLSIESPEANLIHEIDKMYSAGSRLATEVGGLIENLWGQATLSGGECSLRQSWLTAEALTPIMDKIPHNVPIICSHSLVGMVAVAAGFKHVINCVIDNHAQWFVLVPGAVNLVQGPSNYASMLKMGVPESELRLVGSWVPKEIVDSIVADTEARLERAKRRAPRRILVPIGGAGAQKKYISAFVKAVMPLVKSGAVEMFLNAGDREANHESFDKLLRECDVGYQYVDDYSVLKTMIENPDIIKTPVVLLAFKEYFPALGCTDMLIPICDILVVKPSELAFYPIPKLMVRRVGDHEQYSAVRATEVGDGTPEARTIEDAMHWMELLTGNSDLFNQMNRCVLHNHSIGMYNGSKSAVEIALKMAAGEPY